MSGNHGSLDAWVVKLGPDPDTGVREGAGGQGLTIYPSPVTDMLNVRLPEGSVPNGRLEVLDITGQVVMHRSLGPGARSLQIPVEGWAEGLYCLRLDLGGSMRTARFVKQ